MTWGIESQRHRAICGRRRAEGQDIFRPGYLHLQLPRRRRGVRRRFQALLRPDDECVRGGGEERPGRDLQKELETLFESQNQSPSKGLTSIPGNFPARHDRASLIGPSLAPFCRVNRLTAAQNLARHAERITPALATPSGYACRRSGA